MDIPPHRPTDTSVEQLGFRRKRMVRWFSPSQLLRTAGRAGIAEVLGAYSDKRELQAAIDVSDVYQSKSDKEVWLDFVADLGDGFGSTYTLAYLLSRPTLSIPPAQGAGPAPPDASVVTQRGSILVLGGDQVYPTASRANYNDRFVGPYEAAFPFLRPEIGEQPQLFAIPGNHDWYDGLTNFLRLFTQKRSLGAWKTCQARSYFAVRLPHRWWLWGTDIQLQTDIDKPQLDYFVDVACNKMKKGDRIILCTATPSWVQGGEAYHNLAFFERNVIRRNGGVLALTLTGDLHHYARYESVSGGSEKIIAGGGGAYLFPTHALPAAVDLDLADPIDRMAAERYHLKATFPTPAKSRRLVWRCLGFPVVNLEFAGFLGTLYLLYAWFVQSSSKMLNGFPVTFMESIVRYAPTREGLGHVLADWWKAVAHSPASVVFTLIIVASLTLFPAPVKPGWREWIKARLAGGLHGLAHLALNLVLIWLFAYLNLRVIGWSGPALDSPRQVVAFTLEMLIGGSLAGSLLMAVYFIGTNLVLGLHANEVFSAQSIPNFKNFLRLHIDERGRLTVYPIGISRVYPRRGWKFMPGSAPEDPIFVPRKPIAVHMIEDPIVLSGPDQP